MADNRKQFSAINAISALPKEIFAYALQDAGISPGAAAYTIISLAGTCKTLHRFFQNPACSTAVMRGVYQVVIDDDRELLGRILHARPRLLLMKPPRDCVIESQLTWQRFLLGDDILTVAVKRKQLEMIKLLLSYYNEFAWMGNFKKVNAEALAKWSSFGMQNNQIVIPEVYSNRINKLIDVFVHESFHSDDLSQGTYVELELLFKFILPVDPVKLDNYIDVELLLFAAFQAYKDNFDSFYNWAQRDAFCIYVIGLIQSVLIPEVAKLYCESMNDLSNAIKNDLEFKISSRAAQHLLKKEQGFYHTSRDAKIGLGYQFSCGIYGYAAALGIGTGDRRFEVWETYIMHKQQSYNKIRDDYCHEENVVLSANHI